MTAHEGSDEFEETKTLEVPGQAAACSVLVVDDDPDCREVIGRLLKKAGYQVQTATSAREAVAASAAPEIGLLVTDLWMAGGNGMQLVEEVSKARPELEVVVFSGHATPATRQTAHETGCFCVVDKPNFDQLLIAVKAGIGGDRVARLRAEGRGPARQMLGRVLLVDDHGEFLQVVKEHLENRGYRMTTARDGQEALALFKPGEFDLVLMDVNMPRLDGVETTRAMRAQDPAVSILLLSGEVRSQQLFAAQSAGADSLLAKPVSLPDLERKACECVVLTRHRRRAARRKARHQTRRMRRSAPETAFHWLRSPRTAKDRHRLGLRVLIVLLAVTSGLGAASLADWTFNAGRATTGFLAGLQSRLDRFEGYLQRDERRELQRDGREQEPPGPAEPPAAP